MEESLKIPQDENINVISSVEYLTKAKRKKKEKKEQTVLRCKISTLEWHLWVWDT